MLSQRLVVVFAIVMFATACGGGNSSPSTAPSPTPSPTPTPGGPSSSVAIPVGATTLGNAAFAPDELNVAAGTTVTWMNTDSVSHTSTSDAAGWDSGIVAPGGRFSAAFQTPGRFSYHCAIHPGMIGAVVVH
jgi:plastocyanin